MKRLKILMTVGLLTTVLYGCEESIASEKSRQKDNTISSVQSFSDRENTILTTAAETAMVFDFQLANQYKELKVWIEKYRFGKLIDDKSSLSGTDSFKDSGTIVFAAPRSVEEDMPFTYQIGIGNNGQFMTTAQTDENQTKDDQFEKMGMVWGSLEEEKSIPDNEDFLLGYIGLSSDDSGISSVSSELFHKLGNEQEELQDYDIAYLIKARFIR